MAGSVNKVILVGNLGKDPEIRTTQDGQKMATGETWTDWDTMKGGEDDEIAFNSEDLLL